ncbi:TrlF family AAA-like ATPase [Streptococcus sp.]
MVGNKWYKTDLHLHSPESVCFKDRDSVTAEEWIERCIQKGLECVALTDHNSGNNIDEYKRLAEERGLVLFPGVEVTCGDTGTHLLILFETTDSQEVVNDFLIRIGVSRTSFGDSKPGTTTSVLDVIEEALKDGKVVIPAHIDEFNGVCYVDNTIQEKILSNPDINAVQFVQKEFYELSKSHKSVPIKDRELVYEKVNERYFNKVPNGDLDKWYKTAKKFYESQKISCLTFSDNPHGPGESKHGLWGIGSRYTYIKMSETPTLSSLRDALRIGDLRVKSDFVEDFNPNIKKKIFLEKLIIKNTIQNTEEIVIEFNQDLTTIIGSRGTGKSFITKLLAFVLHKENFISQFPEVYLDYNNFAKENDGRSGVLKDRTEVVLYLQFDDNRYEIIRTMDDSQNHVYYIDEENVRVEEPFERLHLISKNINIYLQKQIFEMSKNQTSIRDFLDAYCSESIEPFRREIHEKESFIKKLNLENQTKMEEISKLESLTLEIRDLENKYKRLSNPKYQKIISDYRRSIEENIAVKDDIFNIREYLKSMQEILLKGNGVFENSLNIPKDIQRLREQLRMTFLGYQSNIGDILNKINESIDTYLKEVTNSTWGIETQKIFENYKNLETSLSKMEFEQIQNLSGINSQLIEKRSQLSLILSSKELVERNKEKIEAELNAIWNLYTQICKCRREFVTRSFEGIKVSVIEKSDFEGYVSKLRLLLGKQSVYDDQFDQIIEKLQSKKIKFTDIYDSISNVKIQETSDIFNNIKLYKSFMQLSPETLLEIRLLTPDDKIVIILEINGRKVELTNASAGQKTSAMLTMILALGNETLVMDQPEDDLDSQLINSLIVQNILLRKSTRQIVAVTHNANIPVNGDSELVIAMGDTKELSTEVSDSIDSDEIKGKICSVMEGGAEAFNKRAIRYGFRKG